MSKASEWAAIREVACEKNRPMFKVQGEKIAEVDDDGELSMTSSTVNWRQAAPLARWILDTFGDELS